MGKKEKVVNREEYFFFNKHCELEYHKKCQRCKEKCKQSFRCRDVICNIYERR